jgi:hypothetical protein
MSEIVFSDQNSVFDLAFVFLFFLQIFDFL